ncbi:MAG: C-GCAxxG-C-C family protein [Candidatus Gastranaerophilales bacterium]|nr:C-GCAxxG-C-C family protein [Candidatus Gastranaerophilales bacterium]
MKETAKKYFSIGYSCSESMVMAAAELGLVSKDLLSVASSFSGGMGSGCLCGAVAGAQMIIGALNGRNQEKNGMDARVLAKKFIEKFKEKNKATCCKILTLKYKDNFASPERKLHCSQMVEDAALILEELLELKTVKT